MDKYNILEKLGKGKFGIVFKGSLKKNGELVAIKTELSEYKMLKHETKMLNYLYSHGCRNIPSVYWYGMYQNSVCLVIPYYKTSLYDYISKYNKVIDTINLSNIMIQCIEILENIHSFFVIHRDIKPHNFMYQEGEIYLIDFGLSQFCVDECENPIPNVVGEHIVGTPNYISYYIHEGNMANRRDDLISLGYVYMFLQYHDLPWYHIPNSLCTLDETHIHNEKNENRMRMKEWNVLSLALTNFGSIPILKYMDYCYSLSYEQRPNYDILKGYFENLSSK